MLPAGFEIENPRTKDLPGMDWIKNEDSPTALDARDDRLNLFVDLHSMRQVYYYAVRAVSPGIYHTCQNYRRTTFSFGYITRAYPYISRP